MRVENVLIFLLSPYVAARSAGDALLKKGFLPRFLFSSNCHGCDHGDGFEAFFRAGEAEFFFGGGLDVDLG